MNKQERQLAYAQEALRSAALIVGSLEGTGIAKSDLSSIRTAANQARQATQALDILFGMLDSQV